tara:strand:- start:23 stop:175 length:153 start_codon:yes stop_codon:yes gene_type:complete
MKNSDNLIEQYVSQLTEKEKLSLEKAKEILGDSLNISKSIGYLTWLSSQK